ncbi:hypothetical protein [Paenibacillus sp. FSL R5-0908]
MNEENYFFFEWLIVGKGMSQDEFTKLAPSEVESLRAEWKAWFDKQ